MTNGMKILADGTVAQEVTRAGDLLGFVFKHKGVYIWGALPLANVASGDYCTTAGVVYPTKAAAVRALEGGGK